MSDKENITLMGAVLFMAAAFVLPVVALFRGVIENKSICAPEGKTAWLVGIMFSALCVWAAVTFLTLSEEGGGKISHPSPINVRNTSGTVFVWNVIYNFVRSTTNK